ncbi:hypothetical protein KFL_000190500 [Klebsormidium nitens]|uniref:Uncharacterized protein n=1 Tax=Klebsormidium nitens TaxID=105231 RepID=A0A1Y1HLH8_KLENI|nr:hypothetical protein KFL_000190500 [Klebsormidium nitens]|eukprot:GAQ78833.1 hypothetical protein KFL_000190500 [Klebsormidium nitens]
MDSPKNRPGFRSPAFNRRYCLIFLFLFWSFWAAYSLYFHGALYRITWVTMSKREHSIVGIQKILNGTTRLMNAAMKEGPDVWKVRWGDDAESPSHSWEEADDDSADVEEEEEEGNEADDESIDLLPLEPLHEEFLAGRATVFLLRIQKAASSTLDVMFSTHVNMAECQPNIRALERLEEEKCNQLFILLHYAEYKPDSCTGLTAWDDPAWEDLDCIPWIFSYTYEAKYHRLPEPERARVARTFQSSRLISGHFSYGIHSIGHRGAFAYVTTLRHPVSRVVSWWNWNIQLGKLSGIVSAGNATFDDFVWDDGFRFGGFQKSNHMTRVLCNEETGNLLIVCFLHIRGSDDRGSEGRLGEDTPLGALTEITRAHYECALRNLRNFALVFLAENMSDVEPLAPLVSRLFNMKRTVGPLKGTETNPTTLDESAGMVVRSSLSEATTAKLAELNSWDAMLYEKAGKLHELSVARLKEMAASKQWSKYVEDAAEIVEDTSEDG